MEEKKLEVNETYSLKEETLEKVAGGVPPFGPGGHFPRKTKNNSACPKCGEYQQIAIGKYVEDNGMNLGVKKIVSCDICDLHWIGEDFYESEEVTYTFVDGDMYNSISMHVIPKPF